MESATASTFPCRPAAFRPYKKRAADFVAASSNTATAFQLLGAACGDLVVVKEEHAMCSGNSVAGAPLDLSKKCVSSMDKTAEDAQLDKPAEVVETPTAVENASSTFREAVEFYSKYAAAAAAYMLNVSLPPTEWEATWRQYNLHSLAQQNLMATAAAAAHVPSSYMSHYPPPVAPPPPPLGVLGMHHGMHVNSYESLCAAAAAAASNGSAKLKSHSGAIGATLSSSTNEMPTLKRRAPPHESGGGRHKYSNLFSNSLLANSSLTSASTEKLSMKEVVEPATSTASITATAVTSDSFDVSESRDVTSLSSIKNNNSKETDFLCSCGHTFVNLYQFTVHLRESGHRQRSAQRERDIPKLVRGQDMWINSETEQTREILRCIRCKQSFRTLPDLTMHMIQTKHYAEIVYNDSGRCLYVNNNNNNQQNGSSSSNGDTTSTEMHGQSTMSSGTTSTVNLAKQRLEALSAVNGVTASSFSSRSSNAAFSPPPPPLVKQEPAQQLQLSDSTQQSLSSARLTTSVRPEITEADSASGEPEYKTSTSVVQQPESSVQHENLNEKACKRERMLMDLYDDLDDAKKGEVRNGSLLPPLNISTTNLSNERHLYLHQNLLSCSPPESPSSSEPPPVLQQIQSFVEKSLPPATHNRKHLASTMYRKVLINGSFSDSYSRHSNSANGSEQKMEGQQPHSSCNGDMATSLLSNCKEQVNHVYLAPDSATTFARPEENPLSSLQKLVETTDKRRASAVTAPFDQSANICRSPSTDSCYERSPSQQLREVPLSSSTSSSSSNANVNLSFMSSSPTVIMVNPTYIYQPSFPHPPSSMPPYYSPWVHAALPLFGAGMGSSEELESSRADASSISALNSEAAVVDSGSAATSPQPRAGSAAPLATCEAPSSPTVKVCAATDVVQTQQSGGGTVNLQKKAKCNFCGKPFANKGQVRLHISKGKCPNLLPRCRSTNIPIPTHSILNSPFAYMPLDYATMAAAAAAAVSMSMAAPTSSFTPSSHLDVMPAADNFTSSRNCNSFAMTASSCSSPSSTLASTKKAEERLRMYCNLAKELTGSSDVAVHKHLST